MTEQEVRAAYAEKYKAFPDLVERILGQFDYKFWNSDNSRRIVDINEFRDWKDCVEGYGFWDKLWEKEKLLVLTRESIDAAYAEFGIENTKKMETDKSLYNDTMLTKGPTGNKGGPGLVGDTQPKKEASFFDQVMIENDNYLLHMPQPSFLITDTDSGIGDELVDSYAKSISVDPSQIKVIPAQ